MKLDDETCVLTLIYSALGQLGQSVAEDRLVSWDETEGLIIRSPLTGQRYIIRLDVAPPPKPQRFVQ
jgi:hypothetical protein